MGSVPLHNFEQTAMPMTASRKPRRYCATFGRTRSSAVLVYSYHPFSFFAQGLKQETTTTGRKRNRAQATGTILTLNSTMADQTDTSSNRRRPNILVTGTPGVGKTSTASLLAERFDFLTHVNIGELIQQHKCYDGRDEQLDTNVLDEDKLLDILEPIFEQAEEDNRGIVTDFHVCEMFPERWFDLVLVLRSNTEVLYDRLKARGYAERKLQENMESEIMQVILEEARDAYDPNIVHEVPSNTVEDMESTVQRVQAWSKQWITDHGGNDEER